MLLEVEMVLPEILRRSTQLEPAYDKLRSDWQRLSESLSVLNLETAHQQAFAVRSEVGHLMQPLCIL